MEKLARLIYCFCFAITVANSQSDLRNYYDFKIGKIRFGNSLPKGVRISSGENTMMHITNIKESVQKCTLTKPDGITVIDMFSATGDERISYWYPDGSEGKCGAYIKNITEEYEGVWKLQIRDATDNILGRGVSHVKYVDLKPKQPTIELTEGLTEINKTLNENQAVDYCEITVPVLGTQWTTDCLIHIPEVVKELEGNWDVKIGYEGKVEEVNLIAPAEVYGIDVTTNAFELKSPARAMVCHIHNGTNVTMTFCRFTRVSDGKSLHLVEGLGNEAYRYFGAGLEQNECGLAMEAPTQADLGTWQCIMGYKNAYGEREGIVKSYVSSNILERQSDRIGKALPGNRVVVGGLGHPLTVGCSADISLKYCWFKSPTGQIYNPSPEEYNILNASNHLLAGQCDLIIPEAELSHAGSWTCNMSPRNILQMNIVTEVTVRISETALAAEEQNVLAIIGQPATLRCKSVALKPMQKFCMFTLPDGNSLSLDAQVTEDNAIEDLYYYGGTSLANGECYINIKAVQSFHYGTWKCTAAIGTEIGTDTIEVTTSEGLTLAAISGIVVAALVLIGVVGVIIKFTGRKRQTAVNTNEPPRTSSSANSDEIELYNLQLNIPTSSNANDNP